MAAQLEVENRRELWLADRTRFESSVLGLKDRVLAPDPNLFRDSSLLEDRYQGP